MAVLTCFIVFICLYGVSRSQIIRTYTYVPTTTTTTTSATALPQCEYESCRNTIEDLGALLQIMKSLNNKNSPSNKELTEEIILKLINALVYTSTYNQKGHTIGDPSAIDPRNIIKTISSEHVSDGTIKAPDPVTNSGGVDLIKTTDRHTGGGLSDINNDSKNNKNVGTTTPISGGRADQNGNVGGVGNSGGLGNIGGVGNSGGLGNAGGVDNKGGVGNAGGVDNKGGLGNVGGVENKGGVGNAGGVDNKGGMGNAGGLDNKGGVGNVGGIDNKGGVGNVGGVDNKGGLGNVGGAVNKGGVGNIGGVDNRGGVGNIGGVDNKGGVGNIGGVDNKGGVGNIGGVGKDNGIIDKGKNDGKDGKKPKPDHNGGGNDGKTPDNKGEGTKDPGKKPDDSLIKASLLNKKDLLDVDLAGKRILTLDAGKT